TPELLLRKRGAELLSHPLAGSARRSIDAAEDERAAQALLASTKDHDEHRHVVEAFVDGLAPIREAYERNDPAAAIRLTMTLADEANRYIDDVKPWVIA
ncbi:chorismate-binding protein, partial [Enterobacter hormaechei]|uniref:chorismate-binding protein n=1 Tax=Enterobacter hormaechei TaxID=158836 RepID=UPI0020408509